MVERAPRDRRSFDILSVKKEAKLSASEANDEEVGKGDADLRQSNCRRYWPLPLPVGLRSMAITVSACLSLAYLKIHNVQILPNFLWLWLGPPLTTEQYIIINTCRWARC